MGNNKVFKKNGLQWLCGIFLSQFLSCILIVFVSIGYEKGYISALLFGILLTISILALCFLCIAYSGLKVVKPNEAAVLTLFGKYYGLLKEEGFYFVNPFASCVSPADGSKKTKEAARVSSKGEVDVNFEMPKKRISLKAMTLKNNKQKVNDGNGNPIEIGVVIIWKVVDPLKAVFDVEDFREFVSIQSDSSIRTVARAYAYDGDDGEETLTGSTQKISDKLQEIIQEAVAVGGIEIIDAKIAHLAYAPEIASAMLQRQQADAIIAARQKIVEGAVGMVEQALTQLSERQVVELDDERRAQMVSNLLVVLCANKETQPIVNSGSIY